MARQTRRLDLAAVRALARARLHPAISNLVDRSRARWVRGVCRGPGGASAAAAWADRLPHIGAVLVRIVPKLAERIPGDRVDGLARGVPATALVPGIETCACAARGNRTLRGQMTMPTTNISTTPY